MTDALTRLAAALADRYTIERELGEGGMATVYLAEDLKHDRKVALKVLKPELAAVIGAERFVVEIKTTAALQHPHILPLFDSGTADGFLYYVMPYIQGETLRSKLDRETQLGIDEAVKITTDVADALDYAHRHGVIHRDIKPENILLHDGRPMVADFGIALALSAAAGGRITETGLSLGTPHYMSPEQATGEKGISNRSDIYSLGSVLYEMLTGNPPHTGASAQQIIMKIVTEDAAPVTRLRKSVPTNIAAAIATAVEKLPADRFDSAKAFADALKNPAYRRDDMAGGAGNASASARWMQRLTIPLGVALVLALFAAGWGWTRKASGSAPLMRLPISLPQDALLQQQPGILFALSQDGSEMVYTGPGEGDVDLWVRPLDALTATRVPGTSGADSPFLSPDGQVVAFYRGNPPALYTVTLRGGPRQTLASDSTIALGGDFGPDGSVYFVRRGGIRRVPAGGGVIEQVTRVDSAAGEQAHGWIDVLPNGKGAVFTIIRRGDEDQYDIAALNLSSGKINVLFRGVYARYADGHLLYADAAGGLFAIAFDQGALKTTGTPVPIVAGLSHSEYGLAHFAVSATGTLLYGTGAGGGYEEMVWVDRQGRTQAIDSTITGPFEDLAISPDGRHVAFTQRLGVHPSVWIKELDHGPVGKLTLEADNNAPSWSAGGREVTFVRSQAGTQDLYERRADGSTSPAPLLHAGRLIDYGFVSPDGQWFIYQTDVSGASTGRDIFARRTTGDTATIAVAATSFAEVQPRLSPDGRWIAYVTRESNVSEVYVSPFPNTQTARTQVSVSGGFSPLWSRNGRELFYADTSGMLIAAKVETAATFQVRERTPLFNSRSFYVFNVGIGPTFDVSLDGQRFIMTRARGTSTEQLILVQNWTAGLPEPSKR
jgi:Tol biopolymer transport system component